MNAAPRGEGGGGVSAIASTNTRGFAPLCIPDSLFGFQAHLAEWSIVNGRAATFADCGLGKTPIQLVCADNVLRHTNRPVLILTPLAVARQTVAEGEKFGIGVRHVRDGRNPRGIVVTNYERLHLFDPADFAGVVCDESSILKNYAGATRNAIVDFLRTVPFRFLFSATPSPNDHTELGNSVEALGIMRRVEMLAAYFVHDGGDTGKWRIKGHAFDPFWSFVASWARAVRKPSDIGFPDDGFVLPPLRMHEHLIESRALDGYLFPMDALTLQEQRAERRETIEDRCAQVAAIANADQSPFLAWCSLNAESEALRESIVGAHEVTGSQSDEEKEELLAGFASRQIRCLVTKPSIAGYGLNWQHCGRMSFFPSHSHEQFYQSVRRCWRFGRKKPVDVHIVTTQAESAVMANLMRKEAQSMELFSMIVANMASHYHRQSSAYIPSVEIEVPSWL